jgi:hypothetical protein
VQARRTAFRRPWMFEPKRLFSMLERKEIPLGMQCFTGNAALVECWA